jgi:hypothetical protein
MSGSSIAAPDAAGWVTDFLNAAYFSRPRDRRDVDDLRLAFAILTTRWQHGGHRRLRAHDVLAFHRAFGRARFLVGSRSPRGTLDRDELLNGAAAALGAWFPEAYADPARRGWGIAFETRAELDAYVPESRLATAALGPASPPVAPRNDLQWHTYPPVELPAADAALAALSEPRRWPDFGSELGRFTPLRVGGLAGQTFEIEVVIRPISRAPLYTRGYVTCRRALTFGDQHEELEAAIAQLVERAVLPEPPVPAGAEPLLLVQLDTHRGHFMGRARSHVIAYRADGRAWLRDVGAWDPMPWTVGQAYRLAGRRAQHAFWGGGRPDESMLYQVATVVGRG